MKTTQHLFKAFAYLFFIFLAKTGFTQNVGISSTSGFTPDASAGLDVSYTNKGLLVPRVALTASNVAGPISSPATSLLVYNTATAGTSPNNVIPGYYYWSGSAWVMLTTAAQTASSAWGLTGNAGTTAGTNFIGTTDATDFVFKTSNTERARLSSTGSFGIGTSAFDATNPERLLIDAGTTTNTAISTSGTINDYFQFNIQNLSNGTAASTDIVATANNGTDNGAYIDMGINSSTFPTVTTSNTGVTSRSNTAYIYSNAGDLVIGNGTSGKPLIFFTNNGTTGTTTAYGTERMRIDQTGNVGIGTTNPRYPLEIASRSAYTTGTYSSYSSASTDGWNADNGFSYYAEGTTSSTANASTGSSSTYYSIVTAGRVAAKEFNAYSDKREKIVIGQSNGKADLALLNKLKITDYTWIDKIGKSPIPEKKLIAQELRAVYPQAVKLIPGFIPNIYQKPIAVKFDSTKKTMLLNFSKAHNSIKGDLLRIYILDKLHEVTVKDVQSSSALTIDITDILDSTPYVKDIFVFGKKVNDYHTVDYEAVSMLNVSATQELYRQLEQQKEESKQAINDLKKQLEDQNQRIKRLEEKLK